MGLSWQQGPLAPGAIGRFLVPDPLPGRLLYAEPLRRRMRVRFGGAGIADSDDGVLQPEEHVTRHADLGMTVWYTARAGQHSKPRAAWQHSDLPDYAGELKSR